VKPKISVAVVVLNLSLVASVGHAQTVAVQQAAPTPASKSAQHLQNATRMLNDVPSKPAGKDADDKIADLRRHYAALVEAYRGEAPGVELAVPATAPSRGGNDRDERRSSNWKEIFSDVERDLVKIVGGGSSLGPATGVVVAPVLPASADIAATPAPVGTAGTSAIGGPAPGTLDAAIANSPATAESSAANGQAQTVPAPAAQAPAAAGRGTTPPPSPTAVTPPAGTAEAAIAQARAAGVPVAPNVQPVTRAEAPAAGAAAAEAGVVGFAATKLNPRGITDLDLEARRQLDQFRVQLELFYTEALNEAVRKPVIKD
jgi:hypothetical protein